MYVNLYPEVLSTTSSVEAFVRAIWEIVGGGKQLGASYDLVRLSQAFLARFSSFS